MATQITQEQRSTRRSITATGPLRGWRTVDIITIAFLGAALGVAFWGWGVFYNGPLTALKIGYAPLMGLFVGPWFLAGVVGGLVVRRPGAALFCEVVAALVSMLPGTEWGATVLVSGVLQGLGAELPFANTDSTGTSAHDAGKLTTSKAHSSGADSTPASTATAAPKAL